MPKNREFYLTILERLMLEIRNLEDDELKFARSLAYIFHNVPMILKRNLSDEQGEEAWIILMGRAEHFHLKDLIMSWEQESLESMSREKKDKTGGL